MNDMLPKGWVKTTLGEVCAINPRTPSDRLLPDDTEVSFVPMSSVEEESGRLDASQIRQLGDVRKGYTPFNENDVVFAKITPCMENGKIALATGLRNGVAFGSTEFFIFRPYQGLLSRFVLYFLLQSKLRETAEHHMAGASGQKRVPVSFLYAHEFALPPTHEQERIVAKLDDTLSRLERAEMSARRAQEKIKRYRAAVLDAAVSGELTRSWRETYLITTKQKAEQPTTRLKSLLSKRREQWEALEREALHTNGISPTDEKWKSKYPEPALPNIDNVPNLPSSWSWASLDQLLSTLRNGISQAPRETEGLPILRISAVRALHVDLSQRRYLPVSAKDKYRNYALAAGDLLFTRYNGSRELAGVCGQMLPTSETVVYPDKLVRGVPVNIGEQISSFIAIAANNGASRRHIENHLFTTAGQWGISGRNLKLTPIPFPPTIEQAYIVQEVSRRLVAADKLSVTIARQLARTRSTRQLLMDEAFTGRLVGQELVDEPAAKLLDRMRLEKLRKSDEQKLSPRPRAIRQQRTSMKNASPSSEEFAAAWQRIDREPNARRLFEEAGFNADHVVNFYETLRETPEIRSVFQSKIQGSGERPKTTKPPKEGTETSGRFRLIELWLEDFKNLKDYVVQFDPAQGLDVILGWNGTGKSNLFEALVIIFRDLYAWSDKNRWPEKPMNSFRLSYEIDGHVVEVLWQPAQMKRPGLRTGPIGPGTDGQVDFEQIKREDLRLPRFVFGYYSGPTNRLAEHFLPMKQAHYERLRDAKTDDAKTLAKLLEQRRFFCAETHHAKYVLLAFSYKEDSTISDFLATRLKITGFESALFVIRKPLWAKSGSTAEDFWGATGIMRRVMERLRCYAIAPMVLEQKVNYGYRSTTEDHYYFFLPDLKSLHSFAAEYQDARTFFLALESTDFSELIHDVKIQVRVKSTDTDQVSITFHQLSEGEQQLLMVLGLMRFTKSHQSLVLLDEPDTHLNPHWSVDYLKDLGRVMSEGPLESAEQQTSQILIATHDPLVIASLVKEQIHLLKRISLTGACRWEPATVNPRGLGYTGILTSEMFGFRSDLDPETLADLDDRVRLIAREGALSAAEKKQLEDIDKRLVDAGFSKAFSDPYYAAFVRAWGRRYSDLMAGQEFISTEQRRDIDRIASEVLKEAVAEVEKEVKS